MLNTRKQSPSYCGAIGLCVLLFLLAACDTQTNPSHATTSSIASEPATVSETADVIPNVIGSYTGTYQVHGTSASTSMHLDITSEYGGSFSGTCILGGQSYPIQEGNTTFTDRIVVFTIVQQSSTAQSTITINFNGTQLSDGTLTGTFSSSNGDQGTWTVKKA